MRKPRPGALLVDILAEDDENGISIDFREDKKPKKKKKRKQTEELRQDRWTSLALTLEHQQLSFLNRVELATKGRLGVHGKPVAIIQAMIDALKESKIDLSEVRKKRDLTDLLVKYIRAGAGLTQRSLLTYVSPELIETVKKRARQMKKSVHHVVTEAVNRYLETVWDIPAQRKNIRRRKKKNRRPHDSVSESAVWRGKRWWRDDQGYYEVHYNANDLLYDLEYTDIALKCGWKQIHAVSDLFICPRGVMIDTRPSRRPRLVVNTHILLQKGKRLALLRLRRSEPSGRSSLYADKPYLITMQNLPGIFQAVENKPPWRNETVERKLFDHNGVTAVYLPELISDFEKPGTVLAKNHIVRKLAKLGISVVQVAHHAPRRS